MKIIGWQWDGGRIYGEGHGGGSDPAYGVPHDNCGPYDDVAIRDQMHTSGGRFDLLLGPPGDERNVGLRSRTRPRAEVEAAPYVIGFTIARTLYTREKKKNKT